MVSGARYKERSCFMGRTGRTWMGEQLPGRSCQEDWMAVHKFSDVHPLTVLGTGTVVYQFATVCSGTIIGKDCVVGSSVWIGRNCTIGKNVRIQTGAFIPNGTVIEDDVFIGPNVPMTGDKYPRAR